MKFSTALNILILFCVVKASKNFATLEVNDDSNSHLADAVVEAIAEKINSIAKSTNLVFANNISINFKKKLLSRINDVHEIPIRVISAKKFIPLKVLKRKFIVVIISNFSEFLEVHKRLKNNFLFSGCILITLTHGEIPEIQDIFYLLWKIQIQNVNVIFEKDDGEIVVETFMPFTVNNCNDTRPIIINKYKDGKFVNDVNNLFPEKMKNLFGCSVRVSVCNNLAPYMVVKNLEDGGVQVGGGRDFKLISTLSQRLNFTINFTYTGNIGYFLDNGTAEGSLKGLLNNESDLTICDCWLKINRFRFLDSTFAYDSEPIIFVIPPGKLLTNFEKLVYPFDMFVWTLILASFFIGVLSILVIKRRSKEIQNFVFGIGVKTPCLNMFIAVVGGAQKILPRTNFARFLLMIFLMYSLVMRTLYQGSFYKLMQSNKRHKKIDTMERMIKDDFRFYVSPGLTDVVEEIEGIRKRFCRNLRNLMSLKNFYFNFISRFVTIHPTERELYKKKIQIDSTVKLAFALSYPQTIYYNQIRPKEQRNEISDEIFLTVPIVIYTRKDFFMLHTLDQEINMLNTAGLINHWNSEDIHSDILKEKEPNRPKLLTLTQLTGCFQLLFFGYVASFVAFVVERITKF